MTNNAIERKVINQQFLLNELVLDADNYHITVIKSPIGTGKTEFAVNLVNFHEADLERSQSVLVITHRVALVHNIVERYKVFKSYDAIDAKELPHIQKLVITINSLHKVIKKGIPLPQYDLIIIDEFQQVLWSFFGDTFKKDKGLQNMNILKGLIKRARSVLAMDAHINDIGEQWLYELCRKNYVYERDDLQKDMLVIDNQFRPQRGNVFYYADETFMIKRIKELIDLDEGPVVIATMRKRAKELEELLASRVGSDNIIAIHSDSRFNEREREFVDNINEEISKYRVVIYSPSLGSGVDIQARVRAVFGIFRILPLEHTEIMQMMGRCRHSQETFLHIQYGEPKYPIDPSIIYQKYEKKTMQLAFTGTYNAQGYFVVGGEQAVFCNLYSQFKSKRNIAQNELVNAVLQLVRHEYRIIQIGEIADSKERAKQQKARMAVRNEFAEMVLEEEETLSPQAYRQLAENGEQNEITRAQLVRYIICYLFSEVTRQTYDDFGGYDGEGRAQLIFHAELFRTPEYLRIQDKKTLGRHTAMHQLHNRSERAKFMLMTIKHFWGSSFTPDTVFTEKEIEVLMVSYLEQHLMDLKRIIGWQSGRNSSKPNMILRLILNRIGLKLTRYTRGVHKDKYGLDSACFTRWVTYASDLAKLEEKEYETAIELSKIRI